MTANRDRLAATADTISQLRNRADGRSPVAREAGYVIRNADTDEAVVRIYDEIWMLGVNAQDLVADLDGITAPKIRVEINSPGGDVFDGIAIYNALRSHPAEVTTRVDGIAASIASIIAQAGDRRIMQPAAQMMIHNAWGLTVGDTNDHGEMADLLAQQDEILAGIYANRSGRDVTHFRDLMNAETWLTGQRAVDEGLADTVADTAPPADATTANAMKLTDHLKAVVTANDEVIERVSEVMTLRGAEGKSIGAESAELVALVRARFDDLADLLEPPHNHDTEDTGDVWSEVELAEMRGRLSALADLTTSRSNL